MKTRTPKTCKPTRVGEAAESDFNSSFCDVPAQILPAQINHDVMYTINVYLHEAREVMLFGLMMLSEKQGAKVGRRDVQSIQLAAYREPAAARTSHHPRTWICAWKTRSHEEAIVKIVWIWRQIVKGFLKSELTCTSAITARPDLTVTLGGKRTEPVLQSCWPFPADQCVQQSFVVSERLQSGNQVRAANMLSLAMPSPLS
eukprot:14300-Heterococcus_DN1.PRE.2